MKKRDIRTLFQEDEVIKPLPENHRKDFLEKLNKHQVKQSFPFFKIAVVLLFAGCIGVFFINQKTTKPSKPTVANSIQEIEKQYLQDIDREWQNFTKITNDTLLIRRYKRKLQNLDKDYKRLSELYDKQPQDIFVLEELIRNLQHRLSTLKDIQNHLQTLQQKPICYETIVL